MGPLRPSYDSICLITHLSDGVVSFGAGLLAPLDGDAGVLVVEELSGVVGMALSSTCSSVLTRGAWRRGSLMSKLPASLMS